MELEKEQFKNLIKFMFPFLILSLTTVIWRFFWMWFYAAGISTPFYYYGNWLIVAVYALLLFLLTNFYGGYKIGYYRIGRVSYSAILAILLTNLITYFQTSLFCLKMIDPFPFVVMTMIQGVSTWILAIIADFYYRRNSLPHKILLVYGKQSSADSLTRKIQARMEGYQIHESINISEEMDAVYEKLREYKAVILCDLPAEHHSELLQYCLVQSIRTYIVPNVSDILIRGAEEINIFDTPLLLNHNQGLTVEQRLGKRVMDILLSVVGLLVGFPFGLLTALAVKLCDKGPIFIKQKRLTLNGRIFDIYKFRSMVVNAEQNNEIQLASKKDRRITPIGRVIRAIRLDELPQLWNILKGEMSVVGPRPERPELTKKYIEDIPEFELRLQVKAGLTGLAQVKGKYNTTSYDKLKMDLTYISQYSIIMDLKIIIMTLKILFMKDSTEGVDDWS